MESHPARGYLDLLVAFGWLALAAAATALSLDGVVRLALLIPATVLLPGYALVSMTYPAAGAPPAESTIGQTETGLRRTFASGGNAVGGVERVALSVVGSLVVVPGVALAVNFSPYPIARRPIQIGVFGATVLLLVGAVLSRARLPEDERFSPSIPRLPAHSAGSDASPGLGSSAASSVSGARILFATSLLVLASSVGYAFVAPPSGGEFTELYVQSGNVTAETTALYPSTFVRGRTRPVEFAVTNREGSAVEYSYVVALQRVDRSGGANSSTEVVAETEVDRGRFRLADGATRNVTSRVTPHAVGDDLRLVVFVYRGDAPPDPTIDGAYRSLRLPITVTAGGRANDSSLAAPEAGR